MEDEKLKSCCAAFYENDLATLILGENFHPGGDQLTVHLGEVMGLSAGKKVLDVACGPGRSSMVVAQEFSCTVTGIDLSQKNIDKASDCATEAGLDATFKVCDAEALDFDDESFDAIICECALCLFPNRETALSEMFRVLKPGGKLGITDMTISGELPPDLMDVIAYVSCITGALSLEGYEGALTRAGFEVKVVEDQSEVLYDIMLRIDRFLLSIELMERISKIEVPVEMEMTPQEAKQKLEVARQCVDKGDVGYGLLFAIKP